VNDIGYFINSDVNAYRCTRVGVDLTCSIETIHEATNCQNNDRIGKIYKIEDQLTLCVANDKAVTLTNGNVGNYVVIHHTGSIFGNTASETYAIIKLKEKSIILDTNYKSGIKYTYANIESNYKILEKGASTTCPKLAGGTSISKSNIVELKNCSNGICQRNTEEEQDPPPSP